MSKDAYTTLNDLVDFTMLESALTSLEATSREIKVQRNQAADLLREALLYSANPEFNLRVSAFLASIGKGN